MARDRRRFWWEGQATVHRLDIAERVVPLRGIEEDAAGGGGRVVAWGGDVRPGVGEGGADGGAFFGDGGGRGGGEG